MNRAALAIRAHFGQDNEKFMSIVVRQFALMSILRSKGARRWIQEERDGPLHLHPALMEAAAVMPLDAKQAFNKKALCEQVALFAERMGSQEGEV